MEPNADRVLAVALLALFALFVLRNAPLVANSDDYVRLYCGGRVGWVTLGGGPQAEALRGELESASRSFADPLQAARFKTAQTPYSPLTMLVVSGSERIRPLLPQVGLVGWMLGVQTATWLLLLGAVAALSRAELPACPLSWFGVAGLALAWMHAHTSPFFPAPRAIACLATGLALAVLMTGGREVWAHACVLTAAVSHPYSQALNVAVALPFLILLARTPAAPRLGVAAVRAGVVAVLAVALAVMVVALANPRPALGLEELWGEGEAGFGQNLRTNRPVIERTTVTVGLPLIALVFRYGGWLRGLATTLLFGLSLIAAGLLPPGFYAGEYANRVGGAWVAALFGLCLSRSLLPELASLAPGLRRSVMFGLLLVTLPGAVPELAGVRHAPHARPWHRTTQFLPGSVEAECVRIVQRIRRTSGSPGMERQARPFQGSTW